MARSGDNRESAVRFLGLVCILLVSLTSLVEVAHTHDLSSAAQGESLRNSTPSGSPHTNCSLCIVAHSPALASAVVWAGPVAVEQSQFIPVLHGSPSHLQVFALSVRPPPQA